MAYHKTTTIPATKANTRKFGPIIQQTVKANDKFVPDTGEGRTSRQAEWDAIRDKFDKGETLFFPHPQTTNRVRSAMATRRLTLTIVKGALDGIAGFTANKFGSNNRW